MDAKEFDWKDVKYLVQCLACSSIQYIKKILNMP